eukprot:3660217-Rhodomonas_salina.3
MAELLAKVRPGPLIIQPEQMPYSQFLSCFSPHVDSLAPYLPASLRPFSHEGWSELVCQRG